ncbi:MAG: AsmA family protein, partial [Rhodospirillaceae bacterium]|nr:AsmA family protein [Rhodospirillaceae bacterium]
MKNGRILKYVAGTVIVLIVAAVVVLAAVDFNDYKPELQAQVKQATGRDLTIEGDIKLALSLTPSLGVSGVRFANADWGSRPAMATVERFEVQVALVPLISGTIDIQRVLLKGADILLETDAEGRANYAFETAGGGDTSGSSAPEIPVLRNVSIEDARIAYRDGKSEQRFVVAINALSLSAGGVDKAIELTLAAAYNDNPVSATGTLGSRAALLAANQPYPVALALDAGGAKIAVKGTVSNPLRSPKLDLALSMAGDTLEPLSPLAGASVPALGPYSVTGRLKGDPAAKLTLSEFGAKIGGSDLSGMIAADLRAPVPAIDGALKSSRLDVADFLVPGQPAAERVERKSDGRVFPDDPLPLEGLKAVDAILELSIETLVAAMEAKNVAIGLHLKGGDLRVAPLKADVSGGDVEGTLRLNAAAATPALDTQIRVSKFDAGRFLTDMAVTDLLEGRFNAKLDLKGEGKSVRAIMAGLNGRTQLAMGEGQMKSTALDTFVGGPTKMLSSLFSGEQSEFTKINCMVSQFDIKDGMATSKALLFDTEFVSISGKGTINLASEALDLTVDPQPKSVTINTAVPVEITGTLAEPSYGPSKIAAARKVGGLLGAFVFPPALIIGLAETGTGEDNPCLAGGKPKPAATQGAPEKAEEDNPVTQPLKSIEKGVGGVLKK